MKKYQLSLTETQLAVVRNSLEFYSRIATGQLQEILWFIDSKNFFPDCSVEEKEKCRYLINVLKMTLMNSPSPTSSYSITSDKVPESARMACEMFLVMDNKLKISDNTEQDEMIITPEIPEKISNTDDPLPVIITVED